MFFIHCAAVLSLCVALSPGARAEFSFRHHYIDRSLPGSSYGQSCLVDVDRDGDLDFITGGRDQNKTVYWFERQDAGQWIRHVLGTNQPSDVGGTAIDVDGDGWLDHVTGGVWYRNPGRPRSEAFERIVFDASLNAVHDLVAADLDGDGRLDIITMSDKNNLRWYRIPKDPRQAWERHDIGLGVHAGVAVGDIDGDGDLDLARSNVWFENVDGTGLKWAEHPIPFGNPRPPYPFATRCVIADIDRDGRNDLVMTENEIRAGRIAWLQNLDGKGLNWKVHSLPAGDTDPRGAYHSLAVADFDNDGDLDIFTVEMEGIPGARPSRWFIWENADGKGAHFVERVILDNGLGGHEAVVADVDGDGDLDIASKLWRPRKDNANAGRNHADFLENLLVESRPVLRAPADAPYPASRVVTGVTIDWATHQRGAIGSDNFMMTWADDDHQYGIWGDGGGFDGTNSKYRVLLGVARIEGTHDSFRPFNRFGHRDNSEHEANITGKSWGMVCVDGILYAWVHPDPPSGTGGQWPWIFREARLHRSTDHGASWQAADWAFTSGEGLVGGNILQFGRDYAGARDEFVYHYLVEAIQPDASNGELQTPGKIILLRVPKDRLLKRDAYEVYAGLNGSRPRWSKNLSDRRPIFEDGKGIGTAIGISYHPGLKRYLLCAENSEPHVGNWGMFEAPEPWGPWATVVYLTKSKGTWFGHDNNGPHEVLPNCFFWHFPTKWMDATGRELSLNFTGGGRGKNNDSFNTVRVRLVTAIEH